MDVFGLHNLIDTSPCYKSVDPTLIDVNLRNRKANIYTIDDSFRYSAKLFIINTVVPQY